jgi:glycosyltransferase involved in cell wall biosynthesis
MDKITFCIPSKDNLRYLKTCIPSIRKNAYRDDHDIVVFVDRDTDGTIDWLRSVMDEYMLHIIINPDLNSKLYGIGKAYDQCIKVASTDVVMVFHADMMLGKNADKNAFDLLESKSAVCSTRVEPPLHPNAGEKILRDFGLWPEEFKQEAFDKFVEGELQSDKVTEGIFAPWMVYKKEFLDLGGHDPMLKSCREDSDVFNRMMLAGFKFKQPWNSLVYHLTGRGAGSFSGDEERHKAWQKEMENSTKEFIRKWGSNVMHDNFMKPIVVPKYNIEIRAFNASFNLLQTLEPWCDNIYVDLDQETIYQYIKQEEKNTIVPLDKKINQTVEGDIIIRLDGKTFTSQDFQYIQQIGSILKENAPEQGKFKLGNLEVTINKLVEYTENLIKL